jgi:Tat protein translocase TatB subunit
MFGIGGQEIVIIGLLFLVIFGPNALPRMARDLGRFVSEARRSIDEFKEELTAVDDDEDDGEENRRTRKRVSGSR